MNIHYFLICILCVLYIPLYVIMCVYGMFVCVCVCVCMYSSSIAVSLVMLHFSDTADNDQWLSAVCSVCSVGETH